MRVRHFFSLLLILLVATLHFAVQWYAWKVHLFEIPLEGSLLGPPADYLWKFVSWPMFWIVSRRIQHLHFLATLLANSFFWGAAVVFAATAFWRFVERALNRRRRKRFDAASQKSRVRTSPPTRLERIIELNSLFNRRRITEEEYREMRKAIMREHDPQPDSVRPRLASEAAVTYSVPTGADGAAHVAWLDEIPRGSRKEPVAKQDVRHERKTIRPADRSTERDR